MPVDVSEAGFEAQIEHVLRNRHGYHKRLPEDYDPHLCLIPQDVISFIKGTQPEKWQALKEIHQDGTETQFLRRLAREIDKHGALDVLRQGVKDVGQAIDLIYFAPATSMNPDYQRLYEGNIFSVVRQLRYKADASLSLDLALFVNGLPVFTAELKNNLTGQNVRHAMHQYRKDRDPREPLFAFNRCLGHFAVDPQLVYVSTHLRGERTRFLPFNKGKANGAGNPTADNNYPTHYLWEEVWAPDSMLNLLQQFLYVTEEDEGGGKRSERMIFPRYHQLDAVRRLIDDARANGAGRRYLIQHSAGSGKSYSIAWLAHQLASLHNDQDEKVFDTVVVITDRRVLDRQLQRSMRQFEQTRGVVENIDQTSRQLKQALEDGKKIIVTTLQKFPVIVNQTGQLPGNKFAVIVDEAHSSQSGESVKSLKVTLGSRSLAEAADEEGDPDPPTSEDLIIESLRARKQPANISMFAFTATPKNRTLELFGQRLPDGRHEAFSLYSMRQAIEEGFILDVLENYTTYRSYWRLLKTIGDDPEYESRKAKALLQRFVDLSQESISEKIAIIVEHFHQHVMRQINNRARAMIVTRSRLHAVRYYQALKSYLARQGYDYTALVAFSGTVDDGGVSFTEAGLNGFPDTQTASAFQQDGNRFLVVANKFQTGYDEPLLLAMYVDKPLSSVHAVQTLSRLNRVHPDKSSTIVLDFANQAEHIQEAFRPYLKTTLLSEGTDPNLPYDLERKLRDYGFFSQEEVDRFVAALFMDNMSPGQLNALLIPVVERVNEAEANLREEFRSDLRSYTRLYAFLSQIIPYEDVNLEKLYQFARYLWRSLPPAPDQLPTEILENIDLESFRVRQISSGSLTPDPGLEMLGPLLESEKYISGEDPVERLSEIIRFLNDAFGQDAPAAEKLLKEVKKEIACDIGVSNAIRTNPPDKARLTVDEAATNAITRRHSTNFKIFQRFSDDESVRKRILDWIFEEVRKEKQQP